MNKENFVLSEKTTVKEILDYARLYCEAVPDGDEQDRLCSNCKLKFICEEFVSDWKLPKTYKKDFFEKFPNARTVADINIPTACREDIYESTSAICCGDCLKCWNELYEEN